MISFAKLQKDPKALSSAVMYVSAGMVAAASTFVALLAYLFHAVL